MYLEARFCDTYCSSQAEAYRDGVIFGVCVVNWYRGKYQFNLLWTRSDLKICEQGINIESQFYNYLYHKMYWFLSISTKVTTIDSKLQWRPYGWRWGAEL